MNIISYIICAILAGVSLYFYFDKDHEDSSSDEVIAEFVNINNIAKKKTENGFVWRDVGLNDPLYNKDLIFTYASSSAKVQYKNGNKLDILSNSLVQVNKDLRALNIDLFYGITKFDVEGQYNQLNLKMMEDGIVMNGDNASFYIIHNDKEKMMNVKTGSTAFRHSLTKEELSKYQSRVKFTEYLTLNIRPYKEKITFEYLDKEFELEILNGVPQAFHLDKGSLTEGTDAHKVFFRKTSCKGALRYPRTKFESIELVFKNLPEDFVYEVVLFGDRENEKYKGIRESKFTIKGASSFANESSKKARYENEFDPSVIIDTGYNTKNGYVAKFSEIYPGSDREFRILVDGAGKQTSNQYVNCLSLRGLTPNEKLRKKTLGSGKQINFAESK